MCVCVFFFLCVCVCVCVLFCVCVCVQEGGRAGRTQLLVSRLWAPDGDLAQYCEDQGLSLIRLYRFGGGRGGAWRGGGKGQTHV